MAVSSSLRTLTGGLMKTKLFWIIQDPASQPIIHSFIESFNGSFRDECLNTHWFLSLEDAYEKINAWVNEYNNFRPHSSLQEMTPQEFIDVYCDEEGKIKSLPAASVHERMYFSAEGKGLAASENTSLHAQVNEHSISPKSPT